MQDRTIQSKPGEEPVTEFNDGDGERLRSSPEAKERPEVSVGSQDDESLNRQSITPSPNLD